MAIKKVQIEEFLSLSKSCPVFDVRSPSEFLQAHIPAAYNLPLFTDEERKIVGTTYKQLGRQQAIKVGLDYFGTRMRRIVEEVESVIEGREPAAEKRHNADYGYSKNTVLVHCWRGGMRSAAIAWLLDLYGYRVYTLEAGYKAFRKWVLSQFDKQYNCKILGGYTGSGKTDLLEKLRYSGHRVVNLEAIANHKGSAFGGLGEKPQPTQEMFENLLASALYASAAAGEKGLAGVIWLEDESQRIGDLNIPKNLWEKMRLSSLYFIDIPFGERLHYLVEKYGKFDKKELVNAITRIQKRLGGLETKNAVNFLAADKILQCFEILLKYYDRCYNKGTQDRAGTGGLFYIPCEKVTINNLSFLSCFSNEEAIFSRGPVKTIIIDP